jgi:hypothetical protein
VVVVTAKELTAEERRQLAGSTARVVEKGAVDRDCLLAEVVRLVEKRTRPRTGKDA